MPDLTTQEREEVKEVARQLLERLKDLLVIGWRQRVGSRAAPCSSTYESYQGEGKSVYSEGA